MVLMELFYCGKQLSVYLQSLEAFLKTTAAVKNEPVAPNGFGFPGSIGIQKQVSKTLKITKQLWLSSEKGYFIQPWFCV